MTVRISLVTLLAALMFTGIGAGVAVGVMVWEPWDGDDGGDRIAVEPSPTPEASPTSAPEPTPTPYERRLTATEAAATLEADYNGDAWQAYYERQQVTPGPLADDSLFDPAVLEEFRQTVFLIEDCKTADFNETSRAWIVQCTHIAEVADTGNRIDQGLGTYRLFDETGEWNQVLGP